MGRKKMEEGQTLQYDVKTRINQAHYTRLKTLLAASRHRSMAELLRVIICEKPVTIYTVDATLSTAMEDIARLRKELNAIGVNINQVTRAFHLAQTKSQKLEHLLEITELYREVGGKMDQLFPIITEMAKQWLPG